MRIAIVHKTGLGRNFQMPSYLSEFGKRTVMQRILANQEVSYRNHKAYADRHGYLFINDTEPWVDTKPPDFSIWQAALRALRRDDIDVDWLFFTVNDILYVDFSIPLENYIANAQQGTFMATGSYYSYHKWWVDNIRGQQWKHVEFPTPVKRQMISGWTHFVRKCNESIELISMIEKDQRFRSIPRFNEHSSCGDDLWSVWFNGYPELQKHWHLYSHHDLLRIQKTIAREKVEKWNASYNLQYYEKGKCLLMFGSCVLDESQHKAFELMCNDIAGMGVE